MHFSFAENNPDKQIKENELQETWKWLKMSATKNHHGSRFQIALMLRDGIGVEKNLVAAYEILI